MTACGQVRAAGDDRLREGRHVREPRRTGPDVPARSGRRWKCGPSCSWRSTCSAARGLVQPRRSGRSWPRRCRASRRCAAGDCERRQLRRSDCELTDDPLRRRRLRSLARVVAPTDTMPHVRPHSYTAIVIVGLMGGVLRRVRVPDPRRAQDLRLDAGPRRPEPRRPVRAAPAARRRRQVLPQGRRHPRPRGSRSSTCSPRRSRSAPRCWRSPSCRSAQPRPHRTRFRQRGVVATFEQQQTELPRASFNFVIAPDSTSASCSSSPSARWRCTASSSAGGREQQVLAARLAAEFGPDHQLRDPARHVGARRVPDRRLAEPGKDRRVRRPTARSCCAWFVLSSRWRSCCS